jgi:hypothetical protein
VDRCVPYLEGCLRFDGAWLSAKVSEISPLDCSRTIQFLTTNETKLAPLLFCHLKSQNVGLDSCLARFLEESYHQNQARNAVLGMALEHILLSCRRARIETMLIKGTAHFCDGYYGLPASVVVSDLDVVVRPKDIQAAAKIIESAGYEHQGMTRRKGEISRINFQNANQLVNVDLHGHLYWADFFLPKAVQNDLWRHCRPAHVGLAETRVPSIEHELLIRFLHDVVIGPHCWMLRSLARQYLFAYQVEAYQTQLDWIRLRQLLDGFGLWKTFATFVFLMERNLGMSPPKHLDKLSTAPLLDLLLEADYAQYSDSLFHDRILLLRLDLSVRAILRFLHLQIRDWSRGLAAGLLQQKPIRFKCVRSAELIKENLGALHHYFGKRVLR